MKIRCPCFKLNDRERGYRNKAELRCEMKACGDIVEGDAK